MGNCTSTKMSDVGEGLKLANLLVGWLLDPGGYPTWDRTRRLEALHEAGILAIRESNWMAYDRVISELQRLRDTNS